MAKIISKDKIDNFSFVIKQNGYFAKRKTGVLYNLEIYYDKKQIAQQNLGKTVRGSSLELGKSGDSIFVKATQEEGLILNEFGPDDDFSSIHILELDKNTGNTLNKKYFNAGLASQGKIEANHMFEQLLNGVEFDKVEPLKDLKNPMTFAHQHYYEAKAANKATQDQLKNNTGREL